MNAVYILCVKNHINCTEERSRKDGEFTTAPEQRLPGTMPQEGRCPCLFQAAKKFEQLNRMLKLRSNVVLVVEHEDGAFITPCKRLSPVAAGLCRFYTSCEVLS